MCLLSYCKGRNNPAGKAQEIFRPPRDLSRKQRMKGRDLRKKDRQKKTRNLRKKERKKEAQRVVSKLVTENNLQ